MKLKKLVSLALAGVLAVSMLAGCSTKGKTDDKTDETATGVNATTVIAALGKDSKVTFSASATLESTVQKAIQNVGLNNAAKIDISKLQAVNPKLDSNEFKLATKVEDEKVDKDIDTFTAVKVVKVNKNYTEAATVQELAKAIKDVTVEDGSKKIDALSSYGTMEYAGTNGAKHYYKFNYTGEMAVVTLPTTDAAATTVNYVVAFSVTRNATQTAVPTK